MNSTLILQTRAAIDRAAAAGLATLRRPEPQALSSWAENHFYLSAESSYVEMPWQCLGFQRGLMDLMSNDDIQELWVRKSARVGYTKCILAASQYFAAHKKRNIAIWQPTDADRDEFVKTEVEPAIRDNPEIRNIFPAFEKKSKHNTLALKQFTGSSLHLRGGKAAKNYRRLTVDVAIVDELDGFDQDIEKEGPPHQLARRRTQLSDFRKFIAGSTPHIKGLSMIEAGEEKCDVRLRWHFPCPHCKHEQVLHFGGKDTEGGLKWAESEDRKHSAASTAYECESCGGQFTHQHYAANAHLGRWMTADGDIWLDKHGVFRGADDERIDTPRTVGIHIWAGMSEMVPWSDIVAEWFAVKEDRKELQGFVNLTLGEAWEVDGVEQLDYQMMHRTRREHYEHEVPDDVNVITCGIDHQDDRFEFGWCGWAAGEECWHLSYQALYGDLAKPLIWEKLAEALQRQFRKKSGDLIQTTLAVIDHGGHYSKDVVELSRRMGPLFLIPAKGRSTYGQPVVTMPRKKNADGVYLSLVGTDTAKNLMHQRLQIQDPGPGYIHWPVTDEFDEQYFRQFSAEKRIPKWTAGKKRYVWDSEGRRNEAWDVALLNLVAVHILQSSFGLALEKPTGPTSSGQSAGKKKTRRRKSTWI